MQLIQIGKNGPKVAAVGVGCWAWGDRLLWKYGSGYGEDDLRKVFKTSVAEGLSLFDTAEIYGTGRSEKLLGKFATEEKSEILIASKCFPYPWRLTARTLLSAVKRSLKRLGVSQIQLYQLHWPFPPVKVESWMNAMADAVEAGYIRQVGVSNYSVSETERAYKALERRGLHLASNQVSYSLLQRGPERTGLMQLCKDLGVTVIAYSPIAQGLLTGKYSPQNPPPGPRGMRTGRRELEALKPLLDELLRVGISHGNKSQVQVAINWAITKGTLPIPGAKNERQAKENAGALGWSMTEDEMARLDELSEQLRI